MSRFLLLCAALFWMVWAVASPLVWTGCKFQVDPFVVGHSVKVRVTVDDKIDVAQMETVYAKLSGAYNEQIKVPKPDSGWPRTKEFYYSPDSDGTIVITVTVYDSTGKLLGLGRAESDHYAPVDIVVRSEIPWS